ncbi:hypothetical protein ZIOFF_035307 [Zingiber officinale]|uniref:GDSL esterase/lipase n=1 Tax=Zingiber officinale TaxID=94328 RepID=A0A8J5KXJ2_ZINOF|nr:hypothetical protein ZIOFF_035307 [Zingiber officinale]
MPTAAPDCKDFLGKSLFIVGEFGGNDYSTALFFGRSIDEVTTFVPHVVHAISDGVEVIKLTKSIYGTKNSIDRSHIYIYICMRVRLQRLIGLGAVDIIVPGLLPVGCFPLYLTNYQTPYKQDYGPKTGCARRYNTLSWLHNAQLRRALDDLRRKYPAISLRYADYYSQIFDFAINPLKYGIGFIIKGISERRPLSQSASVTVASKAHNSTSDVEQLLVADIYVQLEENRFDKRSRKSMSGNMWHNIESTTPSSVEIDPSLVLGLGQQLVACTVAKQVAGGRRGHQASSWQPMGGQQAACSQQAAGDHHMARLRRKEGEKRWAGGVTGDQGKRSKVSTGGKKCKGLEFAF